MNIKTLSTITALSMSLFALASPVAAQTRVVKSIYRSDDGGVLYVRIVGDTVYGFGEHPINLMVPSVPKELTSRLTATRSQSSSRGRSRNDQRIKLQGRAVRLLPVRSASNRQACGESAQLLSSRIPRDPAATRNAQRRYVVYRS